MKKITFLLLLAAFSVTMVHAQSKKRIVEKIDSVTVIDRKPEYPGGFPAVVEYIRKNLRYPNEAKEKGIEGCVNVVLVIDDDGTVSKVKVEKSLHPLLDEEAVRVVASMPEKWKPGYYHGKPVRVRYIIPVPFKLNNDEKIVSADSLYIKPEFPGGREALIKYLSENVTYPDEARKKNISGLVKVLFDIEKDGTITNAVVENPLHPLLDAEALRVINMMPKWKPCFRNGKPARSKFRIPVTFKSYEEEHLFGDSNADELKSLDVMPEFPGGMSVCLKFLASSIRYPIEAQEKKIQGKVVASFIVEKDGSLSNIKVVESVHPLLDAEAVRVISMMPKWKPGIKLNQPVRVIYRVPVTFRCN
ncbi:MULTISPECIES: energy transducer TonB [unclassified Bacteroides]|uniref:energy transducer TonB n=1 Tax=unclassified Bacteroides TaxID=2646097 RepID=UPI0009DE76ED|nr:MULTISPECIES: energy transducer TonB [unclassified Bacteroides]